MNQPKPYIFSSVRICIILCVLFVCSNLHAKVLVQQQDQDTITNPSIAFLWGKSNALHNTEQYDELLAFLEKHIKNVQPKNEKDSLDVADLYYNQFQGNYYTGNYLESINSANNGMPYCRKSTSQRGKHLRGVLYYKRAYGESGMNFAKRASLSMKTAIEYLSETYNPSLDYLVDAHVFLSSQAAYHGNLVDAEHYIRLATKIYHNNKEYLDKVKNGRYEVILLYRKAYLLKNLAETKQDSLQLVNVIDELDKLHDLPSFQKNERIYYTTALNHVGDWYISHKHDSLTNKKDLEIGSYYLDKSIDLIENQNYPGGYFSFKYNKCKALTLANDLENADILITHLLDSMANDYRKSFFLAQKGLIKAKLKQKDSALLIFHKVIERVHSDTTKLAKDYSNFKPSKVFGESRLIRRVAEKMEEFYSDDVSLQKTISRLYYLAFIQFENSYARTKFNPQQNIVLRRIICGLLKTKNKNTDISNEILLSQTETMMNQMTWQRFYQNRYTNKLPELDSLNYRHLKLRTLLTAAKRQNDIRKEDSILNLINQHESFTHKKFPNLELLSTKEFDISVLQQNLKKDELVLKYMIFENELAIFSITSDTIQWKLLPWTNKETKLTHEFVESIKNRVYNTNIATKLSKILLPDIDPNIQKVIVNPDGELYRIPFEILQAKKQYLTKNYDIRYTSNLKFVYIEDDSETIDHNLAIYAPTYEESINNESAITTRNSASRLAGAKKEAEIISDLFNSTLYTGNELSKEQFIKTAPEAEILHLAMHAEINDKEPGLSRLLFTKNNTVEDDLYMEELYALRLKADLAVLSACNTGVGKENAGRNMESFQRAFTFAGVPATVVSLWEVPDQSTSEIMGNFYHYLKKGFPKSKALKNAKLDYLKKHKSTKLEQPYYWTGFVLYGEEDSITERTSNTIYYLSIGFLIFIAAFFFRKKSKQNL